MANDMAFMNSVVLGTKANNVTPKNFSGIPDPSKTTSTTSTKISKSFSLSRQYLPQDEQELRHYSPAITA
jgi:hypothetical protein